MEYKLCKDNLICCDNDCRKCANLVHDAMTYENKILKMRIDKLNKIEETNKECLDKIEELENTIDYLREEYDILDDKNGTLIDENKILKKEFDKWDKEKDGFFNEIKRLAEERDRIHDELKELKSKKMVPLSDVYRIIAGHNDYHGGNILSALTCIAEGKDVGPVATYEPVNDALTDENKRLKAELKKFEDKCQELEEQLEYANKDIESLNSKNWDDGLKIVSKNQTIIKLAEKCEKLEKENDCLDQECESLLAKFSERIAELEQENHHLDKECEKLRDDNSRLAHGFKDYIASTSELAKECDELRMMNDKLRTMNSDLLYRNGLLMKTTAPNISKKVYIYDELNDKIESLKEDIIRLDKCLSKRQCVQLERIKEERDGE